MHDVTALAALVVLIVGTNLLTWAITRNYYANQDTYSRDVLERIVTAANDPNARGLETALADADELLGRRTA